MAAGSDFDSFFKEYENLVWKIVRSYVKEREISRDLAAEAFIEVHRRWDKIRVMDNPVGYLVRVAVNRAKRYLVRSRMDYILSGGNEEMDLADRRNDPEEQAIALEEDRWVERQLGCLKDVEKEIVVLRDLDGRKFEDIANILSMKLPTVKSHYRRAHIGLAEKLEAEYGGKINRMLESDGVD
jgi:RNA polymerase sigma-70 factor (ECF subfamily)